MKRLFRHLAGLLLSASLACSVHAQDISEHHLKAALLYNFALFTGWPAETLAEGSTLNLCVIGEDPLGRALESLAGKQVKSRPISVRYITRTDVAANCHVLFISRTEQGNLERILDGVRGRAVLTVMDLEGMAQRGVMVNLLLDNRRVVFEINAEAARLAQLNLSSKILRLARAVH